jgi:hypothetical protein
LEKRVVSDMDKDQEREHWRAIAEQLGLSDEGEPGRHDQGARAPESSNFRKDSEETVHEVVSAPPKEETFGHGHRPGQEARAERVESDPPREEPREPEKRAPEEIDSGGEEAERIPQESVPEKRPEERRGGRGRGRGRSRDSRETPSRGENRTETDTTEDHSPPRGRGRGRTKKYEEAEEAPVTVQADEQPRPADVEEEDDEDLGSLSNWVVPSWNELISSLYRPER